MQKFEKIIQKFKPYSKLLNITALTGGISAEVVMFEIEENDGQHHKYIVRWYKNANYAKNYHVVEHEYQVLQALTSLGVAVPTPCYLDTSQEIFPTPYIILAYVEGQSEFTPTDSDAYIRQLAEYLAQIHQLDNTNLNFPFLAEKTISLDTQPPIDSILPIKKDIWDVLQNRLPMVSLNPSIFLHGDFWLGNILWEDGELAAIIDWEDTNRSNPLADLAISRLSMLWAFGSDGMSQFTRHYQTCLPQIDMTHLPYWDLFAAFQTPDNFPEWANGWIDYDRSDVTRQTMLDGYHEFVELALQQI